MYEKWKDYLSGRYDIYGDGEQISRASFRPKTCSRRLFKVEPASDGEWRISLMTRNYSVDINALNAKVTKMGFDTKKKPKYLEILISDFDDARQCLDVFEGLIEELDC